MVAGCYDPRPKSPDALESTNPYNTRMAIDGEVKQHPTMADLYPNGEKPIVKIIKGEKVDPAKARKMLSGKPPVNQNLKGMSQTINSLILNDVPVRQITELLTRLCGTNVVPTKTIENIKISIYMQDISLRSALETICRLNNLWYREGHNIVTLMTRKEYVDDIEIRQTEHTRAFSIKYTNAADMAKIIQALMGSEVYLSAIEDEEVYGHLDPEEEVDLDGEYDGPDLDNSSSQRIVLMSQLGNQMDRSSRAQADQQQAVQDALSAAAAAVSAANSSDKTTESKSKKPLLAILTVFKRNNCIIARSLDESLLNEMAKIIETLDTPTSQVLLEVRILQITLDDEFESFFQFNYGDYSGNTVDSRINPGEIVYEGGSLSTLASGVASASSLGGTISFDNIQATISFYESEGRANTISSPFLMCANNATVNFFVGEEVPLRDDVSKETVTIGDGETINTFIVDILREELGTDLEISTFINEDNTVTMDIEAEISSAQYSMTSISLSDDYGNIIEFPLDGQTKSEIDSIVTAKSGQTIALGGIIRETVDNSVIKTPILGDIPLIKYLFRQENDETQKTETVIILTPHIINHPGLAGEETDQFLKRRSSHSTIIEGKDNLLTDEGDK
nr:hypothetical protein [Desulfobacter hydrogenophilus]